MPNLTGADNATFAENTVNATPQVIDANVVFTDAEGDFNGGTLTVSGLLAEDRVSIANGATITLVAGVVYYDADGAGAGAAVAIGTATGGSGSTFTVTFNADATSDAVDALIQSLTYANVSDTPTASRTLTINVTDATGDNLWGTPTFAERTGANNPLNGFNAGVDSSPVFGDLDGDGDMDAIVANVGGTLSYFRNTGTASAPVFTAVTGAANPFNGIDPGDQGRPALADLDNDGDLDAVIGVHGAVTYFRNTGTASAPVFTQQFGSDNPFNNANIALCAAPTLVDLDGDGDWDAVIGDYNGTVHYFENTGTRSAPVFVERTGAANPFDGVDLGRRSVPAFADVDHDGDLDAVIGEFNSPRAYFENTGTTSAPVFVQRTGSANPFNSLPLYTVPTPTFVDIDGDGDADLFVGRNVGDFLYFRNNTTPPPSITINVTAQNDAPTASGLPSDVTVTEDTASNLDLSAVTVTDVDTSGAITVTLTASAGTMAATSGGAVTVSGSGTGAITLTGTAANIDAFLNTASNIQYTGASNASGDNAATITVTANDGTNSATLGTVNVDITGTDDPMSLTGVASSVTFNENTVNAGAQLLDADVTFVHADNDYAGGTLTVSGLLAEDRVSVASGATISLSSGQIYYDADGAGGAAAFVIGTATGGSGSTFTVTFNSAATSTAIDALIESLTYANVSDAPTASRTLTIDVTDGTGDSLPAPTVSYTQLTGGANPFNFMSLGTSAVPTVGDLDNDGDLDVVIGRNNGNTLLFLRNGTNGTAGSYSEITGAENPISGLGYRDHDAPTLADIDGDGDVDLIFAGRTGGFSVYRNGSNGAPGTFVELTGSDNPFAGITGLSYPKPVMTDLDSDGDLDLVVGVASGAILAYRNGTDGAAGAFTALTGNDNPFNGIDVGDNSGPAFVDFDGDGDLDLVVGEIEGKLFAFRNGTNGTSGTFSQVTGSDNPFDSFDSGYRSSPTFADMDGDGDMDLVLGGHNGALSLIRATTTTVGAITVNVTPQNDAPTASGLPSDVTVTEDVASNLDLSAVTITDPDANATFTVTLTASAGTMAATSGGGVTVTGSGTGTLVLTGTPANIDAFLNTASNITYTGAANASGDDAATITVSANDGTGAVTLGTVNVDIIGVDDPMSLTGLATSVTFAENTVNATPQLLDADVAFVHADNDYFGGALTVSGLLAEDRIAIADSAVIYVQGGRVYYDADGAGAGGAVAIGTATGGTGTTFTVSFSASATSEAIDALIQSLTYANVSDTPTASRDLVINITDATGEDLGGAGGAASFSEQTSGGNPFTAINTAGNGAPGAFGGFNTPAFADLDGDGDLDLVTGDFDGAFRYFENTGTDSAPDFVARTGLANPFNGFDVGYFAKPVLVDLDGDGDLDLVSGESNSELRYFENTGTTGAPVFEERTAVNNPFNAITVPRSSPTFADMDGDGDLDLVIGDVTGAVRYFRNDLGTFVEQTGGQNPFSAIDLFYFAAPALADIDGDGDLDLVVGEYLGALNYFENTGTASAPVFVQRTGAANPFDGVDVGYNSAPTFADIDGDGDLDLVVGDNDLRANYFLNTTPRGQTITVNVTPDADGPTAGSDVLQGTTGGDAVDGMDGDDEIEGLGGDDVLAGGLGTDTLDGGDDNDQLDGGSGDDTLIGGGGDDLLAGGAGVDDMAGGDGDDTYYVTNLGDLVTELDGEGTDTVNASISYTLTDFVENLTLLYGQAINGTGNGLNNVILGNTAANVLSGLAGDDTLNGGHGNDTLLGGDDNDILDGGAGNDILEGGAGTDTLRGAAGADRLDGGTGADTMEGGDGADTYVVDDANDTIIELATTGGVDSVEAWVSYAMAANLENMTLMGGSAIDGTGNASKNVITGNSAANTLTGGAGDDTLDGAGGSDILIGGAGADKLTGGAGADTFRFSNDDVGASLITDKILDFSFADGDVIDLSGITGAFADLAFVSKFTKVAGQVLLTVSGGNTLVSIDLDGDGKADYRIEVNGDLRGTTGNHYTGAGDMDGGWLL